MSNWLKYMTLTVQLADKRVLLFRKNHGGGPIWAITHETFLCNHEAPLVEANKIILNQFGINPNTYEDDFAEIKQLPPMNIIPNRQIFPFIIKMKKMLSFRTAAESEYLALDWYEIVDRVIKDSVCPEPGQWPQHTPTSLLLVKGLHTNKVFD
jgi:hypothetical protein